MVMKRPMVAFLTQLLLAIRSRFTRRARLEAENFILRQQLVVLRHKSPTRGETVEHRSLAAGMAVSTVPVAYGRDHHRSARHRDPLAPTRFPRLLALEVPPRRPSTDRFRDSSADPADQPGEHYCLASLMTWADLINAAA
jgi:hypothetical protein